MIFAVAGVPTNYKGTFKNFFPWLEGMGLNGLEIQCTYGFKISDKNREIIKEMQKKGFGFSIHGPYYINLGSKNDAVAKKSIEIIKSGIELAKSTGINRIIFHPGGGHDNTPEGRRVAINQIVTSINTLTSDIDMGEVRLYPEIGGKSASLGSLDEIIEICARCPYCYPCIDIAHLHAREIGSIVDKNSLRQRLDKVKKALPEKFSQIHFHAYTIQYGEKGEIKHLKHGENMADGSVGMPNLDDFVAVLHEMKIDPWVVSEALDSQEQGAKYMHDLFIQKS